jgi:hypothetical protein
MIKINTLTKEEIDNIPLCQIDISNRVKICLFPHNREHIDNNNFKGKDLTTLKELKEYCLEHFSKLKRLPNFGRVSFNEIRDLLEHAYPDTNFISEVVYDNPIKYTFK